MASESGIVPRPVGGLSQELIELGQDIVNNHAFDNNALGIEVSATHSLPCVSNGILRVFLLWLLLQGTTIGVQGAQYLCQCLDRNRSISSIYFRVCALSLSLPACLPATAVQVALINHTCWIV
jgi:hypothetical protein